MRNLPALLPKATPLLSRFYAKMSKKRQRCAVVNLENNFSFSAGHRMYKKARRSVQHIRLADQTKYSTDCDNHC
jgi:hypothetical protein